jgi:hypothetical protein
MSETFRCDDKETLVAYLYGEIEPSVRREVERHLRGCAACAREIEGLQAVRSDLESWQPPFADLGFSIVQKPATVLRSPRWTRVAASGWAQAAAAVLVLAAGAAIANVHVSYNADGLRVSTGWMSPAPSAGVPGVDSSAPGTATVPVSAPAPTTSEAEWRNALAALEESLRDELAQVKRAAVAEPRATLSPDGAALLRRVEVLIGESEQRQRQELARRMTQFGRDVDMRRSAEIVRLQQDVWRTAASQQDLVNYFRRVSTQNP